jgi:PAS domain S-box-containing protein
MNTVDPNTAERIRAVYEHGLQFAGLLSPDGILLETNPASLRFIGAEPDDVLGRPFWETPWWSDPDERERLRREFKRAAAGGEVVRYEVTAVDHAGDVSVFDFSLVPVLDAAGQVEAVVAEGRDITELHQAREQLRRSEARLSAILTGVLDAIISVDEEQRIELFNRGAEQIFGYAAEEVLGESLTVLMPEEYRAAHGDLVRQFAEEAESARLMGHRGEIRGQRKDGEVFPAEASIARSAPGGHEIYTAVLRDITERKEADAELARLISLEHDARRAAEAATRARDDMLRVVSHDLRNPVTGVLMGTRMLRRQLEEGDPGLEILEGIEIAAERQRRLIRDLSDVASIETGRLSIEQRPHEVAALVRGAVRTFESMVEQRGITLDWTAVEHLPPVLVDRDRIVQVLVNLLENALAVTPEGGRISMEAVDADGHVEVSVHDTGPGIPAEDQERIFERFWRGEQASSRPGGSGLGLAIARGIVEGHGGRIRVVSEPGRGATFRFTLPLAEPDA